LASWLIFTDPPRHKEMRSVAARSYTPQVAARWAEAILARARRRLDAIGDGEVDMLAGYAEPIAADAVCLVLGAEEGEQAMLLGWSDAIMRYMGTATATSEGARSAFEAVEALRGYVSEVLVARGQREDASPELRLFAKYAPDDAVALFGQVLTGGIFPVAACLGSTMNELFGRQPEILDGIENGAIDPACVVEEALRFDPPFHFVPRITKEAIDVDGQEIPANARVMLVIASANRDPTVYARPDVFEVGRKGSHLAFGEGRHYCLGAALARIILREAIRALATWPRRKKFRYGGSERGESFGMTLWRRIGITL